MNPKNSVHKVCGIFSLRSKGGLADEVTSIMNVKFFILQKILLFYIEKHSDLFYNIYEKSGVM